MLKIYWSKRQQLNCGGHLDNLNCGHLDNLEENIFSRLVDDARASTSWTVSIKCWNLKAIQRPFQGHHYFEVGRFASY